MTEKAPAVKWRALTGMCYPSYIMKRMHVLRPAAGFTIPELVVFIGVVMVAILASLIFIHPKDYQVENRNTDRMLHLAQISQAITRYYQATGKMPDGITDETNPISSESGGVNLCSALVPGYLKDLPVDPLAGTKATNICSPSAEDPDIYATGYTVAFEKDGTLVLEAPVAEGQKIALKRKY